MIIIATIFPFSALSGPGCLHSQTVSYESLMAIVDNCRLCILYWATGWAAGQRTALAVPGVARSPAAF